MFWSKLFKGCFTSRVFNHILFHQQDLFCARSHVLLFQQTTGTFVHTKTENTKTKKTKYLHSHTITKITLTKFNMILMIYLMFIVLFQHKSWFLFLNIATTFTFFPLKNIYSTCTVYIKKKNVHVILQKQRQDLLR